MRLTANPPAVPAPPATGGGSSRGGRAVALLGRVHRAMAALPPSLIALLARGSIAALLLGLMARGPGVVSIDHLLARRWRR